TCDTNSEAVPDTPPVVAVIVVRRFAAVVARPVAGSIVATPVGAADQLNTCPATVFPFRSCATAVNCCERPSASSVVLTGLTTTDVTICATDSAAVPATPPVVAVIVATPFASAVATPVTASNVASPAADADVADRPRSTVPR